MYKSSNSIFRVLGMGLFGYVLAWIGSAGAPPEISKDAKIWTVIFFVAIAIIWDVAEFSYENGYKDGKNDK